MTQLPSLHDAKRIVIKIGSALLVDNHQHGIRKAWLESFAADIAQLRSQHKDIIVVTSGSVALGRNHIAEGTKTATLTLPEKQAAAACGQPALMRYYQHAFTPWQLYVAQLLITLDDSENRRRYLNARNTLESLLVHGLIPIINENDTVATDELRFGDNDRLAARICQMVGADFLIILSDVDGLYNANPKLDPTAKHIPIIPRITPDIRAMAKPALSGMSSGGMTTKISAADIATQGGCHVIISNGSVHHPVAALQNGQLYSCFLAQGTPLSARKHWIATSLHARGRLIVDTGAINALQQGKSLLPAGVLEVKGEFDQGDAVIIQDTSSREIGRGLSAYASYHARLICGHHSHDIPDIIGFAGKEEMIHRNDLTLKNNIV